MQQKERNAQQQTLSAKSHHIQELETQLKSVNEELKMVQKVSITLIIMLKELINMSSHNYACNNRKDKRNAKYCQQKLKSWRGIWSHREMNLRQRGYQRRENCAR